MRKMAKGVKVSVIDDDITGIVKAIQNDKVLIETIDGFEMTFDRNELVVDEEISNQFFLDGIDKVVAEEENSKIKKRDIGRLKKGVVPPMEVDLHIEQLTNKKHTLTNYQMLNLQLDTAKHKLEFAIKKRIQKVIFIHGVGEGVLRAELEYLIKRYEGLSYSDANYQKYGLGAIEVYIPQSSM